jgi:NADH kinase
MMILRRVPRGIVWRRGFSSTASRRDILDVEGLQDRIIPRYQGNFPCSLWNYIDWSSNSKQRFTLLAMAITTSKYPHN